MIPFIAICALIGLAGAVYVATPLAQAGRVKALVCAALIGAGALGIYAVNGEPSAPGEPYAARMDRLREADPETLSPAELEERLRDAIRRDGDDVRALTLLGRQLVRTGRELEGITLFERALRIEPSAQVFNDFGEALVALNDGTVTGRAREAFEEALERDAGLPEPKFFLGVAAFQSDDRDVATEFWVSAIEDLAETNPFRRTIAGRAADLLSRPMLGPVEGDNLDEISPEDAEQRIDAMIGRLESRLEGEAANFSTWLTLMRAYQVRGQSDRARDTLLAAQARFSQSRGEMVILDALAQGLQIEGSVE